LSERLRRVVFAELPAWQLLVLAAALSVLSAATLFDWSFVAGRDAFWLFPRGTIGGSQNDMAATLAAYLYYVQSPWRLPLFHVAALGAPAGTNVIFMDVVPVVALAGKLIHTLTGATVNLYGAYLFLCFSLPGVAMTLVLIAARIRYALAAIIAAAFATAAPALLWRWGHVALEAQFLPIGALALYLFWLQPRAGRLVERVWVAYLVLAYLTNIYLFAMVGIVWLCALIQRRLNALATTREAFGIGGLTVAAVTIFIALCGQFGTENGLPIAWGYGYYSMNLLSPFMPQQSGLFPGLGGVIDANGGQYEGFNYLGAGLLLASILVLPCELGWLVRNLRRHALLAVAFTALTAFAISHHVYAGHRLLFWVPVAPSLNQLLGTFRSSGRFFWLIGYAQTAIVIVLVFRRARPVMALCLAGAACLQIFDVQPLREQIIASRAAGPGAAELDRAEVADLVGRARRIEVVPSFQCSANAEQRRANVELMLASAWANVPTNTLYSSRQSYGLTLRDVLQAPDRVEQMLRASAAAYCRQETDRAQRGGDPGEIFVFLADRPQQQEIAPGVACAPLSWARYCERPKE